jgi:hypothetical protein
MTNDHPDPSTPRTDPESRPATPIREALLFRFRDPKDAATVRRLGDLLLDLVNESGQHGPEDGESSIRAALIAVAQDLLCDASNLTEIADERRWNRDLAKEETHFAERALSWAAQVQLLAGAMLQALGVEGPDEPADLLEED